MSGSCRPLLAMGQCLSCGTPPTGRSGGVYEDWDPRLPISSPFLLSPVRGRGWGKVFLRRFAADYGDENCQTSLTVAPRIPVPCPLSWGRFSKGQMIPDAYGRDQQYYLIKTWLR